MDTRTFTTTLRRDSRDGTSYNYHAAWRNGRCHEYVDVPVRVELRGWHDGLPLLGLCVAAAPVLNPHDGTTLLSPEDELRLNNAERIRLRRDAAEHFAFMAEEILRDRQEFSGPGADECMQPMPDYDGAELVEIGLPDRLPAWWCADAA